MVKVRVEVISCLEEWRPREKLLSSKDERHGPGSRASAMGEPSSGSQELRSAPASRRGKRYYGGYFAAASSRENARAVFS